MSGDLQLEYFSASRSCLANQRLPTDYQFIRFPGFLVQAKGNGVVEAFVMIDDKHVPVSRIVWISDVPHFCGSEDCTAEGRYEVSIEADDSLFGSREERDAALEALEQWQFRS